MKLGSRQLAALEIYVFDPCVVDGRTAAGEPPFPGRVEGSTLTIDPSEGAALAASAQLTEAANSANDDGDGEMRDALTALVRRVGASSEEKSEGPRK